MRIDRRGALTRIAVAAIVLGGLAVIAWGFSGEDGSGDVGTTVLVVLGGLSVIIAVGIVYAALRRRYAR